MKKSPEVLALESQVVDLKSRLAAAETEIANLKRLEQRIERLEGFTSVVMHEEPISSVYCQSVAAREKRRVNQQVSEHKFADAKPEPKRRDPTKDTAQEIVETAEFFVAQFGLSKELAMAVAMGGTIPREYASELETTLAARDTERVDKIMRNKGTKRFKFPRSLSQFLADIFPNKDPGESMVMYKKYLTETLPPDGDFKGFSDRFQNHKQDFGYREPFSDGEAAPRQTATDEIVQKFLNEYRSGKCFTPDSWLYFARRLDRWVLTSKPRRLSENGTKGSDGRWKKK